MKSIRRLITVLSIILLSFAWVPAALAHPLGNFTINHYAGLHVSRSAVSVDYVLDMAEIPAFQELAVFDANQDGRADPSEAGMYHASKCASLRKDLQLALNDIPATLTLTGSSVEFPAGAGGLPTLRLTCEFQASVQDTSPLARLTFVDSSYRERLGWREIVVTSENVRLEGEFASSSLSSRLTSYPEDLLASPLDQREVTLGILPLSTSDEGGPIASAQTVSPEAVDRSDAFTRLIALDELTLPTVLLALLISFVWGAMHAMTPGHGKTIVGAYLVGARGTLKHAVYLGLTTTITHTLGVFALGLVTLFASNYIVPERLFPWLTMLSGLFVVGIGASLFAGRLKSSKPGIRMRVPGRTSIRMQTISSPVMQHPPLTGMRLPHHVVLQSLEGHSHSHGHVHGHSHDHSHLHDPHAGGHSHTPPETVTWRSLLALGVSGGLIPCPSALVVLLGAIALNRIGFGLVLVLAFSLGLAGALTAIGMIFIYAGKLFQRFPSGGKVVVFLPVLSALFVSLLGVGIIVNALMELGIL